MTTTELRPSVDAFRALARSSPWRWRTLHFRHRSGREEVEAWLQRPGELVVLTADGRIHQVTDQPSTAYASTLRASFDSVPGAGAEIVPPKPVPSDRVTPAFRPDGLVAERPPDSRFDHDAPMWQNYTWVAMLDPVELSHHVDVADLREDLVAGRTAWRADLCALPGYDPRCGGNCCELLYSEAGLMADFARPDEVPEGWRGRTYPDHHDVALDVETGVVVRCLPVGGPADAPMIEVDILEVDADLDALLE